ncbi:MAG: response regulator [Candidatus Eisenbacteria bacterium]|uniref:Response regulator n=1 Tax=Eiseniibacteriota bacterium TaxID=2212470 RepID=A0A938BQ12_UNCEI|nr:response regulator [Candidatus Eisenbacteria bacterium]
MSARILIVDDDIAVTRILKRTFELAGYAAEAVGDGRHALTALARQRFDAMVCDIEMPNMTGRELCRRLASEGPYLPRCVFIVTSHTEDEERGWIGEFSNIALIEKPVGPKQLLRRVARGLLEGADGEPGALRGAA